jgi:large subunit ribosomal protein L3
MNGLLGKKVGMTQVFKEDGTAVSVTAILAGPCVVVQKKSVETDGYNALKVGYEDVRESLKNKPDQGQFKKAGVPVKRHLKEFRLDDVSSYEVGQEFKVDIFEVGKTVDVTGTSKGKGFAGTIKRHGQHRGPMTHGSHYHRGPGAMGACAYPGKVFKGKNLPGHMGAEKSTSQNLEVVRADVETNILLVKGAVPGAKNGYVTIKTSVKAQA